MTTNPLISEILEQPEALRRVYQAYVAQQNEPLWAAAALLRAAPIIYMTGMVTSEYASYAAASLLNQAGCPTVVQDASEFLYYHYHADSFPGTPVLSSSPSQASQQRLFICYRS